MTNGDELHEESRKIDTEGGGYREHGVEYTNLLSLGDRELTAYLAAELRDVRRGLHEVRDDLSKVAAAVNRIDRLELGGNGHPSIWERLRNMRTRQFWIIGYMFFLTLAILVIAAAVVAHWNETARLLHEMTQQIEALQQCQAGTLVLLALAAGGGP